MVEKIEVKTWSERHPRMRIFLECLSMTVIALLAYWFIWVTVKPV